MISVIVLAAGESKRFRNYSGPKQFITFQQPGFAYAAQMWENVVMSLDIEHRTFPVIRRDFYDHFHAMNQRRTQPLFIAPTRGQAESLHSGLEKIIDYERSRDLLVLNCDNGFAPGVLDNLVLTGRSEGRVSCVTFEATENEQDRWSYIDDHPRFLGCAEKRYLSPNALAGAYYFPDWSTLYAATSMTLREMSGTGWEPYISHVLNHIAGLKVSCRIRRDDWYDWGTKESFEKSIGVHT